MSLPKPNTEVGAAPRGFQLQELLSVAAFPHPVSELQVRETHISWVILTGEFAYKIKKPVRFDFIDCSTLEQRRHLCEAELRLNRRLAPQLYVEVVPITRRAGGLQIGGDGPPVEYAVRMRQFASDTELPRLLAVAGVERGEMISLAELLAHFHMRALVATDESVVGAQAALDAVLGNLEQLLNLLEPVAGNHSLRMLGSWCHQQAQALEPLLQLRAKSGCIRECHGDLHAGNIVRFGGRLLPFDCIEFAAELRWIDVIDDLAFLVMDLRSRRRHDLAMTVLSRYLEVTGDYEGVSLLPFYCVYRALVRAKIDVLALQQQVAPAEELRSRLQRRLEAALEWTKPHQPVLTLMHGPSGSGKSWLSEQLVGALPAVRIRSDVERKRLAGIDVSQSAAGAVGQGIYSAQLSHRTYARLADCAERCLRAGIDVIIDAASLDPTDREVFQHLASALHASFAIVACQSDPIDLAARILQRGREHNDPSDASLAVLDAQLRGMQPFNDNERKHVISVDTAHSVDVQAVARAIGARAGLG
jgi:aminoglycoside phosphotransferase family enzyme/predicted kinase